MGYLAAKLTPEQRQAILNAVTPIHPDVICDHITLEYGVSNKAAEDWDSTVTVQILSLYQTDKVQALTVAVNGSTTRKDMKTYHITLSIDRSQGAAPKDSNQIVASIYNFKRQIQMQPMIVPVVYVQ